MIIHFKKTILIFVLSVCFNMFYINPECGRCCKRESKVNNQQGNNQCCKSCKGNKFQDVNSGSKEIKRDGGIKNNNIKNNTNYDEIRGISNNNEMTDAEIEKVVKEQKEVEERIKKEQEEKAKKEEEERKQKEEEERLKKEEEDRKQKERIKKLKEEQERKQKEAEEQQKLKEEKRKEEEAKRQEEERKQKEEEERLKKEEDEKKKKEAEEKAKEEERKRKLEEEKQRKEAEEKSRLEEAERKQKEKEEEEKRKKEEEEKKKKEEERKRKLEEEQKKLKEEEDRKKEEEERKRKLEEEKLRKEAEEKTRLEEEERKRKLEEEKLKKQKEEEERKQRQLEEGREKYPNIEKFKKEVEEIIKKIKNDGLSQLENIRGIKVKCKAIRRVLGGIKNEEYKINIERFLNENDIYICSKLDEINKNINNSKNYDEKMRKDFLESLDKDKKYEETYKTEIKKSTYVAELYNVPFLSSYNGVGNVMIPFAFELTKDYEGIFPEKMIEIVNNKLIEYNINKNKDFHIYFCYQYFVNTSTENMEDITYLLFRPHYFIAKDEIDECRNRNENPLGKENINKFIYNPLGENRKENICVVFGHNKCLFDGIIDDFALHGGSLSAYDPVVGFISKNTVNNIPVFYSFVLEKDKKIAAMTIHFFKFIKDGLKSNIGDEIAKCPLKTIGDAINFASTHNDTDVANFLKGIIKENAK